MSEDQPLLGLATTRELLEEIQARGECEHEREIIGVMMAGAAGWMLKTLPDEMLSYRTVDSQ